MKVKEAKKITDSFTKTTKMPGLSYSLPAWECKTGSQAAENSWQRLRQLLRSEG